MQEGNSPLLLPPPFPCSPGLLFPSMEITAGLFYLGTFCLEKKLSLDKLIPHPH